VIELQAAVSCVVERSAMVLRVPVHGRLCVAGAIERGGGVEQQFVATLRGRCCGVVRGCGLGQEAKACPFSGGQTWWRVLGASLARTFPPEKPVLSASVFSPVALYLVVCRAWGVRRPCARTH